jgi:hypothetical protein
MMPAYNFPTVSSSARARFKRFLKMLVAWGVGTVLGATLLAYAGDYAIFRYRVASNRQPLGQVTIYAYDAIPQKSGKTQFVFEPPQVETCANALFPHSGYVPCWYLQRHNQPRTDM